jgi:NADPH:quinone reductase-like Zn-dependent oxidoreductase
VLPLRGAGTWQDYVHVPADWAVPIPGTMEDETAAQLYINPVTAWVTSTEVLRLGGSKGRVLVVNAGGSALGRVYAQLAPVLGFRLIAVTRSSRHTAELLRLGAERVIAAADGSLREAVLELTGGRGADAAIDAVGGAAGEELALCVRPGGAFLALGLLSGQPLDWSRVMERRDLNAGLFHLRHWNARVSPAAWHMTFRHVLELAAQGRLSLEPPLRRYPLAAFRDAVRAAESGSGGKIMLTMP